MLLAAFAAMMTDVYYLGITSFGSGGLEANVSRDSALFRVARDAFVAALAFGWIAYRVVKGSAREKLGSV